MKKFLCIVGVLHFIFLNACTDYLDIKNNNRLAVPDKLEDLQALLDNFEIMNVEASPSYLESAADDYFLTDNGYNAFLEYQKPLYIWSPVEYTHQNDWGKSYTLVYNANFCLDMIRDIPKDASNERNWNNVYGSALFFRANSYLGLLWTYASAYDPVGDNNTSAIVLRENSDFNKQSRLYTTQECYDQVIADALEAAAHLPDLPVVKSRPSKAAAYGLLARAYLSMGMYKEAYEYANLSLEIYNQLMDYNNPLDGIDIHAEVPFTRFNKETIFYSDIAYNFFLHSPWDAYVDTTLFGSFADGDLRKYAFFSYGEEYVKFKGTYSNSISNLFSGLTTAEMLFIKFEAMARMEDHMEAIKLLENFLRYRWNRDIPFIEFSASSKQEAIEIILSERRKELMMRGLRLSDVKRLNREGHNIIMKRKVNGELVELPPNSDRLILNLPADIVGFLK